MNKSLFTWYEILLLLLVSGLSIKMSDELSTKEMCIHFCMTNIVVFVE